MPPPGSTIVAAADDVDSLYYNPFAASSSTSSFSSAYTPRDAHSSGAKPTLRRRGSDAPTRRSRNDHDPFAQDAPASPGAHARARTMDAVVGSSSATNLRHPLAVSNLGSNAGSSRSSLTDTRPRLKRLLSDLETTSSPKLEDVEVPERVMSPTSIEGPKERVVIIHEVSPKDSLPGVALKYGISLADLRRANQMWPSDQIHLRKALYIPLDKSHKAKDFVLSQLEMNSTSPSRDEDPVKEADKPVLNGAGSPLTIRRIPASQLSFFPPPSSSSLSLSPSSSRTMPRSANTSRRRDAIPFEITPSNLSFMTTTSSLSIADATAASTLAIASATSPSGRSQIPSLSTLFSNLPIGRISFDSSTSTPSQISDDQEHEMSDVSHRNSFDEPRERRQDRPHAAVATKASPNGKANAQQDGFELRSYADVSGGGPFPKSSAFGRPRAPASSRTKPPKATAYVSPERGTPAREAIRTSQLQPSLAMQLPLRPRRSRDG